MCKPSFQGSITFLVYPCTLFGKLSLWKPLIGHHNFCNNNSCYICICLKNLLCLSCFIIFFFSICHPSLPKDILLSGLVMPSFGFQVKEQELGLSTFTMSQQEPHSNVAGLNLWKPIIWKPVMLVFSCWLTTSSFYLMLSFSEPHRSYKVHLVPSAGK